MNVTVWNEYSNEVKSGKPVKFYPKGIHEAIKKMLSDLPNATVVTAVQSETENGLTAKLLKNTDVLIWWSGNMADRLLSEVAARVQKRVLEGMGVIFIHTSALSKPFKLLTGTTCAYKWRDSAERERVYVIKPTHPIARGLPEVFTLDDERPFSEPFDVPEPDDTVFLSWFPGGEVIRSGLTFTRGLGKIFYFRPGSENSPTLLNGNVIRIIKNAVEWAAPNKEYCAVPETVEVKAPPEPVKKSFFRRK